MLVSQALIRFWPNSFWNRSRFGTQTKKFDSFVRMTKLKRVLAKPSTDKISDKRMIRSGWTGTSSVGFVRKIWIDLVSSLQKFCSVELESRCSTWKSQSSYGGLWFRIGFLNHYGAPRTAGLVYRASLTRTINKLFGQSS